MSETTETTEPQSTQEDPRREMGQYRANNFGYRAEEGDANNPYSQEGTNVEMAPNHPQEVPIDGQFPDTPLNATQTESPPGVPTNEAESKKLMDGAPENKSAGKSSKQT